MAAMASSMSTETTITPEIRTWLMQELRFPVMATIGKSGMPSLSVIWFDLDPQRDDVVLLNTLAGRVKDRHLRRDPRISLCFEDGTDYVTIEGRAELSDDHGASLPRKPANTVIPALPGCEKAVNASAPRWAPP